MVRGRCHAPADREDDPLRYRHGSGYVVTADIEDIYARWDDDTGPIEATEGFVQQLLEYAPSDEKELQSAMSAARKTWRLMPRRSQLLNVLPNIRLQAVSDPAAVRELKRLLVKKASKSQSGVLVITVLSSPYPTHSEGKRQKFSCAWNCYYCPNEPGQPRSYLHDEPAVKRANENGFDAVLQFTDRAATLAMNGHPVDKIELLVLGGTWASYPHAYQEEFVRDLFYAANTFGERHGKRRVDRFSLFEEQALNESSECKIIGLTLETRPDTIDACELRRLRHYGCTRVQLGVQHADDTVLRNINRGCSTADTVTALALLKDACYKVDIHLMPNLPGASLDDDRCMFRHMLHEQTLQADQWKIYPCEIVPWTVIKRWYNAGDYVPYDEETLSEVLSEAKQQVHPWIRLNRVVRDIPSQYVLGGVDAPNLRQDVLNRMAARGQGCCCIRCREVGDDSAAAAAAVLIERAYDGSFGRDFFLSFESGPNQTLLGFLRLRFPPRRQAFITLPTPNSPEAVAVESLFERKCREEGSDTCGTGSAASENTSAREAWLAIPFPELDGAALIRELHVYGQLVPATRPQKNSGMERPMHPQHVGFGKRLIMAAEDRAARAGYTKLAVIAGIGTRNYYRRLGYEIEGGSGFMIKRMPHGTPLTDSRVLKIISASRLCASTDLQSNRPRRWLLHQFARSQAIWLCASCLALMGRRLRACTTR